MIYVSEFQTYHELNQFLGKVLKDYFSSGELSTLMWDLNIQTSAINTNSAHDQVVLEIVAYTQRHNKTIQLWNYVAKERRNLGMALWDGSTPPPAPEPVSQPVDTKDALIAELEAHLLAAQVTLAKLKAL